MTAMSGMVVAVAFGFASKGAGAEVGFLSSTAVRMDVERGAAEVEVAVEEDELLPKTLFQTFGFRGSCFPESAVV